MDSREFKHLEGIPLDEDNLVLGEDPEVNIKSKACINLGFITLNSITRFNELNKINRKNLATSPNSFEFLTKILEQFLITSINLTTISDLQNTQITEHYRRRLITVSNSKILPDLNYCQNLMYSKFKPWSSTYGALGYYNILAEDFEEYYTPSEIIYYSSKEALDFSRQTALEQLAITKDNNYRLLASVYTDIYKILDEDSETSDDKLYSFSSTIITRLPLLALIYRDLEFYSKWLPKVYDWYLNNRSFVKIENPSFNEERASNTLIDIIEIILNNVLDKDSFTNLGSKFIRQTIDGNLFDVFDELSFVRRSSSYIKIDKVNYTIEEELINEFFEVININTGTYQYRDGSYLILSSFIPPGGYTMLLNLIGCNLLNRAYILAYREINSGANIADTLIYRRILRLVGLAGICFTKTNVTHLVNNGLNLMSAFELNITNIQINNLLDI